VIGEALALGLGVMKATDLAKEVFDRVSGGLVPRPYLKSAVATGLSAAAAAYLVEDRRDQLVLGSGIAGAAALLHELHTALSATADSRKTLLVQRESRAAVQALHPSAPGRRIKPL
jgi:hypothetical protein